MINFSQYKNFDEYCRKNSIDSDKGFQNTLEGILEISEEIKKFKEKARNDQQK